MEAITPEAGAGISASTLSVVTSTTGWSRSTRSPSFTSQRATVPSTTLSPSAGSSMATRMIPSLGPGIPPRGGSPLPLCRGLLWLHRTGGVRA